MPAAVSKRDDGFGVRVEASNSESDLAGVPSVTCYGDLQVMINICTGIEPEGELLPVIGVLMRSFENNAQRQSEEMVFLARDAAALFATNAINH